MNIWLVSSIVLVVLAVLILVVCIIIVVGPIKKIVTLLLAHLENIQKQLTTIQKETVRLTATIDQMKTDIEYKKDSVQSVIQSVKNTGVVLNQVSDFSHDATSSVMKKANNDPQRQAEVEHWTNTAMGFIHRKTQ